VLHAGFVSPASYIAISRHLHEKNSCFHDIFLLFYIIIQRLLKMRVILSHSYILRGSDTIQDENLTFEDGILFCKYIFQCAIHKTLKGVPEEWMIHYKTHEMFDTLGYQFNPKDLERILFHLNIDNLYSKL
jgi:hypothetical protein